MRSRQKSIDTRSHVVEEVQHRFADASSRGVRPQLPVATAQQLQARLASLRESGAAIDGISLSRHVLEAAGIEPVRGGRRLGA